MKKILLYTAIIFISAASIFNSCVSEDDLIDYYIADTTLLIWSQKFNKSIYGIGENDTIMLGVDTLATWSRKVNIFIDSFNYDTIIYGTDNFEMWRTKFNTANWDYLINPIADSIINRWAPEPDSTSKFAIATLTDTLDYYGIWNKADVYRIYAANSETSANINTKNTSFTAIPQDLIAFTTHKGYTGDGGDYISEVYNTGVDADSFQLDNGTIHVYNNNSSIAENDILTGINDGTNWIEMTLAASAEFRLRMNNTSADLFTLPHKNNTYGGITSTRNSADSVFLLRNSGVYVGDAVTSVAIPNQVNGIYSHAFNFNGSETNNSLGQISFYYIGSALTELQAQKLYEAENRYLDYLNSIPVIVYNEIDINPEGGGDYTTIGAALTAITDNTYLNRYNLNLADTTEEYGLNMKNWVNIIGNDTTTARIIGYLPANTAQATIIATSAIEGDYINFNMENVFVSMQNGRYALHSDAGAGLPERSSEGVEQNFTGCRFVHEGNAEADAFWSTEVWNTPDAMGMGLSYNMTINIDSCYTESKGTNATKSRGIAQHSAISDVYQSTMNVSNTICVTSTTNALRIGMIFNNQDEYYFDNVEMFGALLIDGSGTYTDNTTQTGTNPIVLDGNLIAD